ncbi:hypothetical protein C2142_04280 [Streptomyces sp. CB01881]|nr:hypothetical protein C2142_04280 [Streptomyces sp. CB01881]
MAVVEQEVDEQVAQPVAVGVAGVVDQTAPGPVDGLGRASGFHQGVRDPAVLLGFLQVLGEDRDVVVGVAGEFGELLAEVADGEPGSP